MIHVLAIITTKPGKREEILGHFRAAALASPAAGIAAALMGSANADFFYDQLFVKEPGTAHPTPWHQDQPYWPVKGWQIASVWVALDRIDRSNGAVEFIAGSHRWGVHYRPTAFRKGHEIGRASCRERVLCVV